MCIGFKKYSLTSEHVFAKCIFALCLREVTDGISPSHFPHMSVSCQCSHTLLVWMGVLALFHTLSSSAECVSSWHLSFWWDTSLPISLQSVSSFKWKLSNCQDTVKQHSLGHENTFYCEILMPTKHYNLLCLKWQTIECIRWFQPALSDAVFNKSMWPWCPSHPVIHQDNLGLLARQNKHSEDANLAVMVPAVNGEQSTDYLAIRM